MSIDETFLIGALDHAPTDRCLGPCPNGWLQGVLVHVIDRRCRDRLLIDAKALPSVITEMSSVMTEMSAVSTEMSAVIIEMSAAITEMSSAMNEMSSAMTEMSSVDGCCRDRPLIDAKAKVVLDAAIADGFADHPHFGGDDNPKWAGNPFQVFF